VKKEGFDENNEILARFVDLLQDLSNKMIRLEKNLQNQQAAPSSQQIFQLR
jgi:BMFP domain-containing protein YqiC